MTAAAAASTAGASAPALSEAAGFVFEPVVIPRTNWVDNPTLLQQSPIVNCSAPDVKANACWKAMDNEISYSNQSPNAG